jgi:hypothetical protein
MRGFLDYATSYTIEYSLFADNKFNIPPIPPEAISIKNFNLVV